MWRVDKISLRSLSVGLPDVVLTAKGSESTINCQVEHHPDCAVVQFMCVCTSPCTQEVVGAVSVTWIATCSKASTASDAVERAGKDSAQRVVAALLPSRKARERTA